MAEHLRRRAARLTPAASRGWDRLGRAAGSGRPPHSALIEAVGEWLDAHNARLWELTEAQTRRLVERAFEIDEERTARRRE